MILSHHQFQNSSRQTQQLKITLDKYIKQNRLILKRICSKNPEYEHKLYVPSSHSGVSPAFQKTLYLKQIDQLMEQKTLLLKKQQEIQFKFSEQKAQKQNQLNRNTDGYMVLRTAWTKFNNFNNSSDDKIDNLNKVVGMIKNNINKFIIENKKQLSDGENRENYGILQIFKGERVKQKMERLQMENEELRGIIQQQSINIEEKQTKIRQISQKLQILQANNGGNQNKKQSLSNKKIAFLQQTKQHLENRIKILSSSIAMTNGSNKSQTFVNQKQNFTITLSGNLVQSSLNYKSLSKPLCQIMQFLDEDLKLNSQNGKQSDKTGTKSNQSNSHSLEQNQYGLISSDRHISSANNKFLSAKTHQRSQSRANKVKNFMKCQDQSKSSQSKRFYRKTGDQIINQKLNGNLTQELPIKNLQVQSPQDIN